MLLERGGKVRVPAMGFSAAWRRCHGVLKYLNGEKKTAQKARYAALFQDMSQGMCAIREGCARVGRGSKACSLK